MTVEVKKNMPFTKEQYFQMLDRMYPTPANTTRINLGNVVRSVANRFMGR